MKKLLVIFTIFTVFLIAAAAFAGDDCEAEKAREESNKEAALEFYKALMDRDYDEARKYAAEYIQHDPKVPADGIEPLIHYLETDPQFKNRTKKEHQFYNVMADGDLVYFQLRIEMKDMRILVQHSFRFNDEGKIAEHWSAPAMVKLSETENKHPLF